MRRILRSLIWLASVAAIAGVCTSGFRAALSSRAPSPLEAQVLDLAGRLGHPGPLYDEPALPHPISVMPGLPMAAVGLSDALGSHVWLIRLLSLVALLGVAGIIAAIVRVETGNATLAVASAGLLLAGFAALGGQPGAASPEPLMLVLVLAAFLSLRAIPGVGGAVIAALLVSAACFTQQQAIGFAAAVVLCLAFQGRSRLVAYVLGMALFGGGGYALLSRALGPWFNFYAWDVPVRSLQFAPIRLMDHLGGELLGTLGALTLATVLGLALPPQPWRGPGGLWLWMSLAALAAGLFATQSGPTAPLAALTSVAALALIGPMAMKSVTGHLSAWPGSGRMGGESVMLMALALQFVALFTRLSPTRLLAGS